MTDDTEPTAEMPIDPGQMLAVDSSLAEFAAALRGPATPRELGGESAMLDLMVAAIAPLNPSKDRTMFNHRFARIAAIAAAMVLSAGGVAAAATGTNPLRPIVSGSDSSSERPASGLAVTNSTIESSKPPASLTTTTSTTTTPTPTSSTTTTVPPPTSTTIARGATSTTCPDTNHGSQVSEVAKDKSGDGEQNHGAVVSAAAHNKNDCDEIENTPETGTSNDPQAKADDDNDDQGGAAAGSGNSGDHTTKDDKSDKAGESK
jgi:hypothetical protein